MSEPELAWLGRVPYPEALERQRRRRDAVIAGEAAEALWALEHDPVVTVGRRAAAGLPEEGWLAARGVALVSTERGGLATYHGPGQLVIYAIIDAGRRLLGPRRLVEALEEGVIDWLGARGVAAGRREGYPGVWVPSPTSPAGQDKIAAVGLHFRRGVSMHGLALNLRTELRPFSYIVPCGISDATVARLQDLDPAAPSPEQASGAVLEAIRARILRAALDAGGGGL